MPLPSRSLPRTLAALGAAAAVAAPATAGAQLNGPIVPSAGISFTANFGQKLTFGLGLDVRVTGTTHVDACSGNYLGAGPYAQVTWLNFSHWRFGAGAQGGGDVFGPVFAVDGELGWTYHTRYDDLHPGEHGLQIGIVPYTAILPAAIEVPMRLVIPVASPVVQPEGIVGAAFAFAPPFGIGATALCVTGRPLRVAGRPVLPAVVRGRPRPRRHARLDAATRAALAGAWLEDARMECASVPAFLALARDLDAAGAPPPLVARAIEAVGDEIRHTFLCAELASALSGEAALPVLLPPPPPAALDRREALLDMVREAWIDGCLGEGAASARAATAAAGAEDPSSRAALSAIARDEARHADLAWSVIAYGLAAGGSEVGDAIAEAIRGPAPEPPRGDPERDADARAARAHGRITQAVADGAWADTVRRARRRARRLLAVSARTSARSR